MTTSTLGFLPTATTSSTIVVGAIVESSSSATGRRSISPRRHSSITSNPKQVQIVYNYGRNRGSLQGVRIVLVSPQRAGKVGAVCGRAAKFDFYGPKIRRFMSSVHPQFFVVRKWELPISGNDHFLEHFKNSLVQSQTQVISDWLQWSVGCSTKSNQCKGHNFDRKRSAANEIWRAHSYGDELISQAEAIVGGAAVAEAEYRAIPDLDYLQELLAIQQQGPTAIGFFGTRNMGFTHQQLIEILSYAMVITKNHIFTSGGSGTNAAVIRGALRAERPDLLTVILPQSLKKQPPESQELLSKMWLISAGAKCYRNATQ